MFFALSFLLLTEAAVVIGGVKHEQHKCPQVYFDGLHRVMLNCSNPAYVRAALVQWRWTDFSGKQKEQLLLQVLNGNLMRHTDWADMGISIEACVENGNCSLCMAPAQYSAGLYHCIVWTSKSITEEKTWLIYKVDSRDLGPIYIAVGAGVGLLLLAIIGVICFCKRKARDQGDRNAESQDLNLNHQEIYSNLI
ncbi:uncharacterized protein LOC125448590 isoform X2 [Stegostoma tigrinum]|uniref:uncharacterized protein LOC125448590 isoform X2 n=1 Tax=Stegostoma tigrinum TaxID=3053191 RepID=UPI00202B5A0C|nr:uncharacterized protein LOC125448590 isoform X2 [Stegostoma tigrinum]